VADGEVFWFITRGSLSGAMPSWASLPEQQRWQLVTYLKTLASAPVVARRRCRTHDTDYCAASAGTVH